MVRGCSGPVSVFSRQMTSTGCASKCTFKSSYTHRRPRLYLPAPACDFREGRKEATKIAQTWHMSHLTVVTRNYPRFFAFKCISFKINRYPLQE